MSNRKRKLQKSWLESYRDYIIKQESPDIFHFWVGITIIATALKRNVYIDRGAYHVFPNVYTFLVAKSGLCRKSKAMDIGVDLIDHIEGLDIIHGRMTVEGLIDTMDKASISPGDPDQKIKPDGSVLLHADELSYMLGKASYITDLISFLTAAYTGKAKLDFLTRGRGLCKVRNPCLTILAGTTPEQMGEIFPSMTLMSGFMARILLIYGDNPTRVPKPKLDVAMEEFLVHDLGCIGDLYGPIHLSEEADIAFDTWYENLDHAPQNELKSFYERKHDLVLKTAMILSVSESDKMIITKSHFISALAAVENVETRMPAALAYVGATQQSNTADMVESIIVANMPEPISHSVLLRRIYKRLTGGAPEFQMIVDSLKESNRIQEEASERGVFYFIEKGLGKFWGRKKKD